MIVAFAGRRSGSLDVDLIDLAAHISTTLEELAPTALVGAAADGGDLLVLEAGLALDPPTTLHLVLPTPVAVFRDDSVEPDWHERFDRVVEAARSGPGGVRSLAREPGTDAYREANQAFVDKALSLAVDDEAVALVVAREGEGMMVEDFATRARVAGFQVVRVDPAVADRRT